jgi:hypothetical protein
MGLIHFFFVHILKSGLRVRKPIDHPKNANWKVGHIEKLDQIETPPVT